MVSTKWNCPVSYAALGHADSVHSSWGSVPAANNLHAKKTTKNVHDQLVVYRKQRKMNMTLEEYFREEPHGAKQEMADFLGITATWLSLLIHGKQQASPHLAIRIEQATQGLVTKEELRGDVFLV